MKKTAFYLIFFLSICFLTSCTPLVDHADPFYNINSSEFPRVHLPLIKPIEATRLRTDAPWTLKLRNAPRIELPKSQEQEVKEVYVYSRVMELEKFAVKDGIIMAYSAYVDKKADPYILNNYYHWFVMVPSENITKGFHTEEEFREYIQTLGIQDPDWLTPDEAYHSFIDTGGCLDWIPDCK